MVQIEPRTKNRPYPQRDLQDSDWVYKNNPLTLPLRLYALSGIAPPDIRRAVTAKAERTKQANDNRHSLHKHSAPQKQLRSRSSFLDATAELETTPPAARIAEWYNQWNSLDSQTTQWTERGITPDECLATGHDQPWAV